MGGHHDTVALLEAVDGSLLEVVQLEWIFDCGVLHELIKVDHGDFVSDNPILLLCFLAFYGCSLRELLKWMTLTLLCQRS